MIIISHRAVDLMEFSIFTLITKPNHVLTTGHYFLGNFSFSRDEEYQEERGAKRHLGTLGAKKLKFTKKTLTAKSPKLHFSFPHLQNVN